MIRIKVADFVIDIDNKYDHISILCKDYFTTDENVDFCVSCTDEEILQEKETSDDMDFSLGYLESICIYRKICLNLPKNNSFVLHSAVIEKDGFAYAFLARSGTGKSTHIGLWKKVFGNSVTVINGDKPIVRLVDGVFYAYGTPWCGKEGWQKNKKAPLKALCFLERGTENKISQIDASEGASRIMKQILIPKDAEGAIKTLELMDEILKEVKSYLLYCNITEDAAILSYKTMSGEIK